VRRKLGPGAGEQLDVADDLQVCRACTFDNGMAVERQAGGDDEAVELAEVGGVEVGDPKLLPSRRLGRGAIERRFDGGGVGADPSTNAFGSGPPPPELRS
jgi:hypothetical protein